MKNLGFTVVIIVVIVIALAGLTWLQQKAKDDALTVYCAHDSIYSEKILRDFARDR